MSELESNLYFERPIDVLAMEEVRQTAANQLDDYFRLLAMSKTRNGAYSIAKMAGAADVADSLAETGLPLAEYVRFNARMLSVFASEPYIYNRKTSPIVSHFQNATDAGIKMLAVCDLPVPWDSLERIGAVNHESLWSLRRIMMPEPTDFDVIERQWGTPVSAAEKLTLKINARHSIIRYGGNRIINGILIGHYQERLASLPDY